jgi:TonB family protein
MRTMFALSLACLSCRAATPEAPEPIDTRPWCEQEGHDWATLAEPELIPEPAPATGVLGFASIDKDLIRRVIREHMWAVEECYELALVHDPNLIGRVSVRFVIEADGHVGAMEVVEETVGDPCLGRCVMAVGKQHWVWPPYPNGATVTITYPFLFSR